MKSANKKQVIILTAAVIFSFALRLYHLGFFEFKDDQLNSIRIGEFTRASNFLVNHGPATGVGINMPPFFPYAMGIITSFSSTPAIVTALFMVLNDIALVLMLYLFYQNLPAVYALIAGLLLAGSPAFNTYGTLIWPQCLIPVLVVFFYIGLRDFLLKEKGKSFVILVALVSLTAQLHMSGFFLFIPIGIVYLLFMKKIGVKHSFIALIIALLLFSPYFYHLLFEGEVLKFISMAKGAHSRSVHWKIFTGHLRMASFDFFRYYFRYDFWEVLLKSAGPFRYVLYPLSCLLMGFCAFGMIFYLKWLITGRKVFDVREEVLEDYPLFFQIAGFCLFAITIGYLWIRTNTPPHYLIVLYPAYSILTGYAVFKFWKYWPARVLFYLSYGSSVLLLALVFMFLNRAGGHPHEYGLSYDSLLKIKGQVDSRLSQGDCPQFRVAFLSSGKADIEAVKYAISGGEVCLEGAQRVPFAISINWHPDNLRYDYGIEKDTAAPEYER